MRFSSTGVFLWGVQADTTLDALPSGCAWFGLSLRSGTPQVFPVLGAAGVSVRGLRPYRFRAFAVVAPEVPNVDPSTSPTQITCLYTFSVLKLVCVILGMDMGGRMVLIICYYYSSSNMMIRI